MSTPTPPPRVYRLTLTDARNEPATVAARLRRLLKLALRGFGFRAGGVEVQPPPAEKKEQPR